MGYPLTFQRLLNRNRLHDGGYDSAPTDWSRFCTPRPYVRGAFGERERELLDRANEERAELESRVHLLVGDLRRLEADAVDEGGICKYIAHRIQVEEEVVAAVLKEFMAW